MEENIPFFLFLEQADETWLKEFASKISTPWDFTAIHVNKNSLDGVKRDIVSDVLCFCKNPCYNRCSFSGPLLEDLWQAYLGDRTCLRQWYIRPLFFLVRKILNTIVIDHNTFTPCTNQQQINLFIHQVVDYFEHDSRVYAYAFSNGEGLGEVWPMMRNGIFRYAFEALNLLLKFTHGGSESGRAYLDAISRYH